MTTLTLEAVGLDVAIAASFAMLMRARNLEPAFAAIAGREKLAAQLRIQRGKNTPDGEIWPAWAPSTRTHREHKGNAGQGLLWDDGTLLDSIEASSTNDGLEVGASAAHAGYIQDGTNRMPAREFLGWTDDAMQQAETTVLNYILGPL